MSSEDRNISKKQKKKNNSSKKSRIIKRILLVCLIAVIVIVGFVGIKYGVVIYRYQKEAERLVAEGGESIFKANQTSTVYDANGEVITSLIGAKDSYYLEFNEIPYFVKSALITSEDRKFYSHSGVDFKAVTRAFLVLIQNDGKITQGGSTITQQLARNVFLSHQVSVSRKIKEMFIAKEIEKKFSKDEILEFYINNIYFGNGYYGVEAAARGYFSKSVTELSLGEIAFICAIPNNPTLYDPYTNSEATTERKNRLLKQMYERKDIDREMYEEALYTTIVLYPSENHKNNYVDTYVRHCATIALMENTGFEVKYYFNNEDEERVYNSRFESLYNDISAKLYTGGYNIYTSIDMEKQAELQKILDDNLSHYEDVNEEGIYTFQGAATCIDNITGKVVAIVGGRSQEYNGYTLNRAYQSYRQPGSTIKPILVYTPLLERNHYPETIVTDEPVENGPVNSPNVYEGDMTLRYAVEKSKNTIAWKFFDELTAETCLAYLKNMDFKKIVASDYVPAASIGGMTYGVSTLEMSSAYAAIENDGIYRSPTCITKITDSDYNVIIDNINYETSKSSTVHIKTIYQTNAARMMTDILKGVLITGTGRNYNVDNAICAAKTGTTNDNKDIWFVGFSKYYTSAIWVGYDMPEIINDNYGNTCSGNIWKEYMTYLHKDLEKKDFSPYVKQDNTLSNGEEIENESTDENSEEPGSEDASVYTDISDDISDSSQGNESETTSPMESDTTDNSTSGTSSVGGNNNAEGSDTQHNSNEDNTTKKIPSYNNYETTTPDNVAPGGAWGGVYQEYWGE